MGVSLAVLRPAARARVPAGARSVDVCVRLLAVHSARLLLGADWAGAGLRLCASVGDAVLRCAHVAPVPAAAAAGTACEGVLADAGAAGCDADSCLGALFALRDVPVPFGASRVALLRAHVYNDASAAGGGAPLRMASSEAVALAADDAPPPEVNTVSATGGAAGGRGGEDAQLPPLRAADVYIGVMVTAGAGYIDQTVGHLRWVAAARALGMRVVHFGPECFQDPRPAPAAGAAGGGGGGLPASCATESADAFKAYASGSPGRAVEYAPGLDVVPCAGCANAKEGVHCRTMCFWRLAARADPPARWAVRVMDDAAVAPRNLLHHLALAGAGAGGRGDAPPRLATVGGDARCARRRRPACARGSGCMRI